MSTRCPANTYRLQISPCFTLDSARRQLDYLRRLGVDWVYLSPILQSTTGSQAGYDVTDHHRVDAARGGRAGLEKLAAAARERRMGLLVDIVPNHVGVSVPAQSRWWWDVLTYGQQSAYAAAFDIDWTAADGKILLPVLGEGCDELAALRADGPNLVYFGTSFPIAPGTAGGSARDIHNRQHYQLVNWRRGASELNYRRFFTISDLVGVRVEDRHVFVDSHLEIARWLREGLVDGLRIDHIDGLADPQQYLNDLAGLWPGERGYTLVEKITEGEEMLPGSWACDGSTGYDGLALVDRVLIDPAGQQTLSELDSALRGREADFAELAYHRKRAAADLMLRAEVSRIARLLPNIPDVADAIAELLSGFSVYRSYLPEGGDQLRAAFAQARTRRVDLHTAFDALEDAASDPGNEVCVRLQQTSGMVMAKGVEDCAFYRYSVLTSLNEVGGDPADFACAPERFHALQAIRQRLLPQSMVALTTHDTKRSEDVRARIAVLAEIADEWADAVRSWQARLELPDGVLANLIFQVAVGAHPISRDRLAAYAHKAANEARNRTSWTDPNADFLAHLDSFVAALYDDIPLATELAEIAQRISLPGRSNALCAKLIALTVPGVGDVYQGTELETLTLADPDNRQQVDFDLAAAFLDRLDEGYLPPVDATGAAKLHITRCALRLRRDAPELFTDYRPVSASGPAARHALAFNRGGAITVATRLPYRLAETTWGTTRLDLPPGNWRDVICDRPATGRLSELLADYPVALLVAADG